MRSYELQKENLGSNLELLPFVSTLASFYRFRKKYEKAEKYASEGLTIANVALGENHAQTVMLQNNLANIYSDQKKFGQAEFLYLHSFESSRNSPKLGPHHLITLQCLYNIGILYCEKGYATKSTAAADGLKSDFAKGKPYFLRTPHLVIMVHDVCLVQKLFEYCSASNNSYV